MTTTYYPPTILVCPTCGHENIFYQRTVKSATYYPGGRATGSYSYIDHIHCDKCDRIIYTRSDKDLKNLPTTTKKE